MSPFVDFLGRQVNISLPVNRIISTVPSQTELLFDLGLQDYIVGITQFCIHPKEMVKSVAKIGGTKKLNINRIKALQPDLVIANKEENTLADISAIAEFCPVWVSDIVYTNDNFRLVSELGNLLNVNEKAEYWNQQFSKLLSAFPKPEKPKKVIYLIWDNPKMVAGGGTFINAMLELLGLKNLAADKTRYPTIEDSDFGALNPDFVLLSSEPFPFKQKHMNQFAVIWPRAKVLLVDGEAFSWFGSRPAKKIDYLIHLANELRNT